MFSMCGMRIRKKMIENLLEVKIKTHKQYKTGLITAMWCTVLAAGTGAE